MDGVWELVNNRRNKKINIKTNHIRTIITIKSGFNPMKLPQHNPEFMLIFFFFALALFGTYYKCLIQAFNAHRWIFFFILEN